MRFSVHPLSRRGGREKNEDRMAYSCTRESGLFAVADGMGGHPEGEVAAQLALQMLSEHFQRAARPRLTAPTHFLHDAIIAGHQRLLRYAAERAPMDTPRTTIVACLLQGDAAYWAHCGDSRLYIVRGNELLVRTRDHSYSERQQSRAGASATRATVNRNVLFTCLGSPGLPVVDAGGPFPVRPGDKLMLCSDGLWGSVSDATITDILARRPVSDAVPELVARALRAAGPGSDNVTVLGVEWESPDSVDGDRLSSHPLSDDEIASSLVASLGAERAVDDESHDEQIERSMRELSEALQRRAKKG